jgi:hypothetical protein
VPFAGLVLLGGCAYRDHDQMGVSVARGGYYDGYYDGSYGSFNDGYWGKGGTLYYADGNHFRHDPGEGSTWAQIHGSGAPRDH